MAEKKQPWGKFYWGDWRKDARLRMCSYAARGLWADMLSLMGGECDVYGLLIFHGRPMGAAALASVLGGSEREMVKLLAELRRNGVFSMTGDPDLPSDIKPLIEGVKDGAIMSRRMLRDTAKADAARENGKEGGHPAIRRGIVQKDARVRRFRRSDNPAKTQRIFEKDGGKCHWCDAVLLFDWDGKGAMPMNFFHIDHLVPIKDGGGNEDENLVPSCASCNHDRKYDINQEVMVGQRYDHKAQKLEARDQKPDSIARGLADARWKEVWHEFVGWGKLPDTATEARARGAYDRVADELPAHGELLRRIRAQGDRLREGGGKRGGWATAPHNWLERDRGWTVSSAVVGQPDESLARAAWHGEAGKLIDALGDKGHGLFVSYFFDAKFEPGPVPRITVAKPFVKTRIEQNYMAALRKAFGDVTLEVAA